MMSTPIEAVRTAVAALNAGNVEGYLRHIDPGCMRWVAGLDQPVNLEDVSKGARHLRDAFEALFLHEDQLFGSGQLVCARWRMSGIHVKPYMGIPSQRRQINVQTCEIYAFKDNLVSEVWTYGDPAQLIRQISAATQSGDVK